MHDHDTYRPTEDEEYMNPNQLEYFKVRLLDWRRELLSFTESSRNELKEGNLNTPDLFDVASKNIELALDIDDMERKTKKLTLIDKALSRISCGEYGYCDLSGEEIGLRRLEVQPTANLCIEVQEMLERSQQVPGGYRQVECFM